MRNLNDMMIFAKVVQSRGFTAAANILGLPKSNISRRVSQLENDLDVQLLERTTRKIHLTEIGEIFYQHCLRIVEEAEQAELSVDKMLEKPRGILRISASVTTGQQLLSPLMALFLEKHPQVQLQLELSNRRVDLIEEGFDIAIRIGQLADSRLVSRYLGKAHIKLYANQDYLAAAGTPTSPDQLTQHRCLIMPDMNHQSYLTLQNPAGIKNFAIQKFDSINDFLSLYHLARDGIGIATLPHYLCKQDIENRLLVSVLPDWQMPPSEVHAIFPSHRGATPKLRVFINFLVENIGNSLAMKTDFD